MTDYVLYAESCGILQKDMVRAIQEHGWPQFGKAHMSLASNPDRNALQLLPEAEEALVKEFGYEVVEEFTGDEDLLACIGGDGTFLSFVHKCGFPKVPIIGINTGHLGFFQEALPTKLRETMEYITKGDYQLQRIRQARKL